MDNWFNSHSLQCKLQFGGILCSYLAKLSTFGHHNSAGKTKKMY